MNNPEIRFLKNENIDRAKWDRCVEKASNSLIYSQSWYLDKISDRWGALEMGDYQYVMPLPYRKKLGIAYLYQPLFCQQLGIFPTPDNDVSKHFLIGLQKHFSFADINLNAMQKPVEGYGRYEERSNFMLPLRNSYETIINSYSSHTNRKLKKAESKELSLVKSISPSEYLSFKKENLKTKLPENELKKLQSIMAFALTKSLGQIYGVYSPANRLCSAAFFIRHKQRVTYLNAASNTEGKENHAMYFLIDQFIREHARKDFILDFEGSMVPGVARFYEGFGATAEKYHHYHWNTLPWWIKWIKQ